MKKYFQIKFFGRIILIWLLYYVKKVWFEKNNGGGGPPKKTVIFGFLIYLHILKMSHSRQIWISMLLYTYNLRF